MCVCGCVCACMRNCELSKVPDLLDSVSRRVLSFREIVALSHESGPAQ